MSAQPKKENPTPDPKVQADPARVAAAKKLPENKIETTKDTGPCGEGDPCGGGFGNWEEKKKDG